MTFSRPTWRLILASIGILGFSVSFQLVPLNADPQTQPSFSPARPQASSDRPAQLQRAFLRQYCIACHSDKLKTAGLSLERIGIDDVAGDAQVWEKVLSKLKTGAMPPARMPHPDAASSAAFTGWLETALDRAAELRPNPGRVGVHRLNRIEYENAVRDVLGLNIDSSSLLLADDADRHGFDNIAVVLSVSPAQLERYMSAARKISRLAVGDPSLVPVFETYDVPRTLVQAEQMSEDLPFGSRGGIAVRHLFPVDAEYVVRVRLRRQLYEYIMGIGHPHELEVRLDGERIKLLTVGGEAPGRPAPLTWSGSVSGDSEWELYMHNADASLEVRFPAKAGERVLAVHFKEMNLEPEGLLQPALKGFGASVEEGYDQNPAIGSVSIGGPYGATGQGETASRNKIFICRPAKVSEEEACATKILSELSRRAYRRPTKREDVSTLLSFYRAGRETGDFEKGIQSALERLLIDPDFLFRVEADPPNVKPGAVYARAGLDLASRLSFFLWSSVPDDQILELAAQNKLADPAVLEQQARRMLKDPKANALVQNFFTEWLNLKRLKMAIPDPDLYPDFDENLRRAFTTETEMFLENELRSDHSATALLDADYTYVNERLARHYDIPNVYGTRFRRVSLRGTERGGLLGQGGILMVTSYPNRTSPVLRGKWLLDIMGMPPPPPPPNVPALRESGENGKPSSVRERMEQHRKNPACAVCHVQMDPLGFSMENFDPIGKWRTVSDGLPVDAMAALPDGTQFEGVAGLRKLLLSRRTQFMDTLTRDLMTYALGREVEHYDLPTVRQIVRDSEAGDYRWSSIISGIVRSKPFRMSVARKAE